ncbi:MAG TPA: hypothetical protein VIU33_05095, partial [Nitrospiria bacterium]
TAIILGKFLAAMIVFSFMLSLTAYMPLLMGYYGSVQVAPILTGYLGIWLLGGVFISVGLFASALTENQIIASFVSFATIIILWLIGWMAQSLGDSGLGPLFAFLSIGEHTNSFIQGILNTQDFIYQGSMILLGLFLTHRVLESQRWK